MTWLLSVKVSPPRRVLQNQLEYSLVITLFAVPAIFFIQSLFAETAQTIPARKDPPPFWFLCVETVTSLLILLIKEVFFTLYGTVCWIGTGTRLVLDHGRR